jgi:Flp pilus assembly protein TadG
MNLRSLLSKHAVRTDPKSAAPGSEVLRSEEGATLVEIAISVSILFAMLFGFIEVSLALYNYHFVSDAAREGTRFAMVRGSNCTANVSNAYCSPTANSGTGATNADIQAYIQGLGFPFAKDLTTSTKWYSTSTNSPSPSTPQTWTACGNQCNAPGNMVQVTVTNNYGLPLPKFAGGLLGSWSHSVIRISSTSSMVIAQ